MRCLIIFIFFFATPSLSDTSLTVIGAIHSTYPEKTVVVMQVGDKIFLTRLGLTFAEHYKIIKIKSRYVLIQTPEEILELMIGAGNYHHMENDNKDEKEKADGVISFTYQVPTFFRLIDKPPYASYPQIHTVEHTIDNNIIYINLYREGWIDYLEIPL